MPLVKAGHKRGHQHGNTRPTDRPQRISRRREGLAPGPKRQEAQNAIADDVSALANVEVPNLEARPIQAEKKVQHRVENPAGVVGGKPRGRFDGNHDQPQNCGDPGFQKLAPRGAQENKPLPLVLAGTRRLPLLNPLFNRIIGSLASDHDIVDVTLAESRAADAHETRLLQQFRNGGAAAITHA